MKHLFAAVTALGILGFSTVSFAGACNFTMKNMFAGPYKVCQTNQDEAGCTTIGSTDDNSDAVHSAGDCSADGVVGSCVMEGTSVVYYEGDPTGLEIGCGFQGGTWEAAAE
jgi:hypothetical protein